MLFTPRLTTAQFSFFAQEALSAKAKLKPLRTAWHGKLADSWGIAGHPVTYEEFACLTYVRRPGHLSTNDAWNEIKEMGTDTAGMLSAGWGLEQEHDPSYSFHMQHDARLSDLSVESMSHVLTEMEKFIHANISGEAPQRTGIGLSAILLFPDKISAFIFDVTVLDPELNNLSYPIDEAASKLGEGANAGPIGEYNKRGFGR